MDPIQMHASLVNPNDPTETNLLLTFAGVGVTDTLSTGQRVRWTPEKLRSKVRTMVGKPVNIRLNAAGNATGHTDRDAIGTVKTAWYDEDTQSGWANLSLWKHRFPKTVETIGQLMKDKKIDPSMEWQPVKPLAADADGIVEPDDEGSFAGIALVGDGADPRALTFLMAAKKDDDQDSKTVGDMLKEILDFIQGKKQDPQPEPVPVKIDAAHEGSYEWLISQIRDHLTNSGGDMMGYPSIIATYSNYAIYTQGSDYFRIDYKRSGDKLTFGEPQSVDPVYQPTANASAAEGEDENTGQPEEIHNMSATPEELQAAKDQQLEEMKTALQNLQASLDVQTELNKQLKAEREAEQAEKEATEKAEARLAELSALVPADQKEALKASLFDNLKTLDDKAYEVIKASFVTAAATLKAAGITTDGEAIENPDQPGKEDDGKSVDPKALDQWRAEVQAKFGPANKSQDKE